MGDKSGKKSLHEGTNTIIPARHKDIGNCTWECLKHKKKSAKVSK